MHSPIEIEPGKNGQHVTYCRLCEAQCGLIATVDNGFITHIEGDKAHPVSQGRLCIKGTAIGDITYDRDRVLQPLKRTGAAGEFEAVDWSEALADISRRLDQILTLHGPKALGAYLGNPTSFSTQHAASAQIFVRSLGSNKLYSAMHVDIGARATASALVYGNASLFPFPDLPDCDFLLILGGNPLVSHMSLITVPRVVEQLREIASRDGVVVVDPRQTETARRFEHQPIIPDTDAWLLIGILKTLVQQNQVDDAEVCIRTSGWNELKAFILSCDRDEASRHCGIEVDVMHELAQRFIQAPHAACYGRVGTNRGRFSTLTNVLIDALNIVTGNFGVRGGTLLGASAFALEGVPMPNIPYGYQYSRIGNFPLVLGMQPGGALSADIETPGADQLHALFLDSGNPVLSYPQGDRLEKALSSLDLFVSLDFYITESNQHAHYILPTPTFVERADTNDLWAANAPEPWIQRVEPVINPIGQTRSEFDIYNELLNQLGQPDLYSLLTAAEPTEDTASKSAVDVADFYLRMGSFGDKFGKSKNGLNLDKILREHPHGVRYVDRMPEEVSYTQIANDESKPCLTGPVIRDECLRLAQQSSPTPKAHLHLFGRRMQHSLNSWMHNSPRLAKKMRPTLLMHPSDAEVRKIEDGQGVTLKNQHGSVQVIVELTDHVVAGSVCYPHGFGHQGGWHRANQIKGANINLLASSDPKDWEQVSGNCFLDGIPVEVEPLVASTGHA